VGEKQIRMVIPATNTYAGLVDLRITSEASPGTIYGDSFTFQIAPYQAQTGWAVNLDSIAEYGRMETALLEVAMTSAAANAKVATELAKRAWAKTLPPSEFTLLTPAAVDPQKDKLTLTLHGYAHTIGNKYSLTTGTAAASAHVNSILGECEFVSAGSITSNTLSFQIDNRAPIRHFQILLDIIKAGDAAGNRWVGGVYADRRFNYGLADNVIAYRYRGGKVWNAAGGEMEPWFAEPGHLLYLDDAPIGPGQGGISSNPEDNPHVVFVSEVEMGPPSNDFPMGTLTMRHEALE